MLKLEQFNSINSVCGQKHFTGQINFMSRKKSNDIPAFERNKERPTH
jgi:hypothetical protein